MRAGHAASATVHLDASERMRRLRGNGLLTFVARAAGVRELFGDDVIAFYDGLDELLDRPDFVARHDEARRRVAEAGRRAAHSMFASQRAAKYILERSFDAPLSGSYPWPTAIETTPQSSQPPSARGSIAC